MKNGLALAGIAVAGLSLLALGVERMRTWPAVRISTEAAYVVRPDGTGLRRLGDGGMIPAAWSPDGTHLALTGYIRQPSLGTGGVPGILVARSDGFGLVTLGPGSSPAWAPDGARIAFINDTGLSMIGVDGTGLKTLVPDVAHFSIDPNPADGNRLAYLYGDTIYVIDLDGASGRALLPPGTRGGQPHWSPDGSRIAFFRDDLTNSGLYVLNADGSGLRLLAGLPPGFTCPSPDPEAGPQPCLQSLQWSANGQSIVSGLRSPPTRGRFEVVDVGSGAVHDVGPATISGWSPDGTRAALDSSVWADTPMIYVFSKDGYGFPTSSDLINPDGSGRRPFTDGDSPLWSPDGSLLAFHGIPPRGFTCPDDCGQL